ncbi:SDR family NAD(P)-dependent oxidoreductase [Rhodoblastus sp.]|uniref:SDR family NAD(P)-dependent oxidoreductase n=1 Tax=Rhodoblastus sp. TaxID=1962975 RepID=UPI003F9751E3
MNGEVAFVTGAASGVGHGIVKRFVEAGGESVAIAAAADVSDEEQVNAAVDATAKAFGAVDILFSNAGIRIVHPIEEFPFARAETGSRGAATWFARKVADK